MNISKRKFLKTSCLASMCFCGFGRLMGAENIQLNNSDGADTLTSMSKGWIKELLTNLDTNLNEEQLRLLVKSASIAHFNLLEMETKLIPFKGKLNEYIAYIEKEWGWKCHFEDGGKVLIADEAKPYCVCPLIDQESNKHLPALCYCSEGFAERMFSVVCEHPVKARIISAVLRGDDRCMYRIEL